MAVENTSYVKSSATGYLDASYKYYSEQQDVCGEKDGLGIFTKYQNGVDYGPGIFEKFCLADEMVGTTYSECQKGCYDGACKK
jgi:hypothetical protein